MARFGRKEDSRHKLLLVRLRIGHETRTGDSRHSGCRCPYQTGRVPQGGADLHREAAWALLLYKATTNLYELIIILTHINHITLNNQEESHYLF